MSPPPPAECPAWRPRPVPELPLPPHSNWHQMVAFFIGSEDTEDADMRAKAPLLFLAGSLLVVAQAVVAIGLMLGVSRVSCIANDQCSAGRFCGHGTPEAAGRCVYCGAEPPYILYDFRTGETLYQPGDKFAAAGIELSNITAVGAEICSDPAASRQTLLPDGIMDVPELYVRRWCDQCVSGSTGDVNMETFATWTHESVAAMGNIDWLSVLLASCMMGLTVSGELKDIALVLLQIDRAADNVGARWRVAVQVVCSIRRYLFLPALIATIPMLVTVIGGDILVSATILICPCDRGTRAVQRAVADAKLTTGGCGCARTCASTQSPCCSSASLTTSRLRLGFRSTFDRASRRLGVWSSRQPTSRSSRGRKPCTWCWSFSSFSYGF
eukprot:COSAG04_NODE_12_length_42844_cov_6.769213_25_plen_384_part_00